MLNKFRDSEGREWTLALNVKLVQQVRNLARVDLKTPAGLFELIDDSSAFGSALWALCRQQAEAAGVSEDDFLAAIDGDVMTAAHAALGEAVILFRPKPLQDKARKQLAHANAVLKKGMDALATALDSHETQASIAQAVDRATAHLTRDLGERLAAIGA